METIYIGFLFSMVLNFDKTIENYKRESRVLIDLEGKLVVQSWIVWSIGGLEVRVERIFNPLQIKYLESESWKIIQKWTIFISFFWW